MKNRNRRKMNEFIEYSKGIFSEHMQDIIAYYVEAKEPNINGAMVLTFPKQSKTEVAVANLSYASENEDSDLFNTFPKSTQAKILENPQNLYAVFINWNSHMVLLHAPKDKFNIAA